MEQLGFGSVTKRTLRCAPPDTCYVPSGWKPPVISTLPRLWEAPLVSIDCETQDTELKKSGSAWSRTPDAIGKVVGVAFATRDFRTYIPFDHGNGSKAYGNVDREHALAYIKEVCESSGTKVVFNEAYERGWLGELGIEIGGTVHDPSRAAALIDENLKSYTLDSLCLRFLGIQKDEGRLRQAAEVLGLDPKKDLWQLHSKYVGRYGEQDAGLNINLWDWAEKEISEQDLWEAYWLESKLMPKLVAMRRRGVRVDLRAANRLLTFFELELERLRKQWMQEHEIVLPRSERSYHQIAEECDRLKIPYNTTSLGNASFKKEWLAKHPHPLFAGIRKLREISTLSSLVKSQLSQAVNGRIHCNLNPLKGTEGGTVTFRFSSSYPNLQQVPKRGQYGRLIRSLFLPEEGELFTAPDYSEQEYRIMVHYAAAIKARGVGRAVRLYEEGGSFHDGTAEWLQLSRADAKIMNFGMVYAMTKVGVARNLGCSEDEAQEVLDRYHSNVPFVKQLDHSVKAQARRTGKLRLLYGHVCHFDLWEPRDWEERKDTFPLPREEAEAAWGFGRIQRAHLRKGPNKLIQGSGAGMMKQGMVNLDHLPLLQVHDELPSSVPGEKEAKKIQEAMVSAAADKGLNVPFEVDYEMGPTWAMASFDDIVREMDLSI